MALRITLLLVSILGATALFAYQFSTGQAGGTTVVVDSTADDSGTCDDGNCTLREAINLANSTDIDTITFSVGGGGVQVISVQSPLPAITQATVIDGSTQPGFSAAPLIVIDGNALGGGDGLKLDGSVTVANLVICNFPDAGIRVSSGANNVILASYIGTGPSGTGAQSNGQGIVVQTSNNVIGYPGAGNVISGNNGTGLMMSGGLNTVQGNYIGVAMGGNAALANNGTGIFAQGADNLIGGVAEGEGNVVSGNTTGGIALNLADRSRVVGNKVGTNAAGNAAIANGAAGVNVSVSADVLIGGTQAGAPNVISGNHSGVTLLTTSGAQLLGNRIGTSADGNAAVANNIEGVRIIESTNTLVGTNEAGARNIISGNGGSGVSIEDSSGSVIANNAIGAGAGLGPVPNGTGVSVHGGEGSTHTNLIGGANFNAGNVIAFNTQEGVRMMGGVSTTLRDNMIYNNGTLGIDINGDGVTQNDQNDTDGGTNRQQNFPQLTSAQAGTMVLLGEIQGTPETSFFMDLFASPACDGSGYGEGQIYLGSVSIFVGASGEANFSEVIEPVPEGQFITAVAMNIDTGDSSEFSNCVQVSSEPPPTHTPTDVPPGETPTAPPAPTDTPEPTATTPAEPTATPPEGSTETPNGPTQTPAGPTATRTPTRTPTPRAGLPGDADCNTVVTSIDVALILQYSAGLLDEVACPDDADASGDGTINSIDSALILQLIAGLVDEL